MNPFLLGQYSLIDKIYRDTFDRRHLPEQVFAIDRAPAIMHNRPQYRLALSKHLEIPYKEVKELDSIPEMENEILDYEMIYSKEPNKVDSIKKYISWLKETPFSIKENKTYEDSCKV